MFFKNNAPVIPDDIAQKVARRLYANFSYSIEYYVENDKQQFAFDPELGLGNKEELRFEMRSVHYLCESKSITPEMECHRGFVKGNGYISLDRFNYLHYTNRDSLIKVLDLIRTYLEADHKQLVYRIYRNKSQKRNEIIICAYISYQEKLFRDVRHEGLANYPRPEYEPFRLWDPPYPVVPDMPDKRLDIKPEGITLLSDKEFESCSKIIPYADRDGMFWLSSPHYADVHNASVAQLNGSVSWNWVKYDFDIDPAVTGDFGKYRRGTKLLFAGHKWTVISSTMMLADEPIGRGPFNYFTEEGNNYETSRIKHMIEGWFEYHKADPVYPGKLEKT